MTTASTIPVSVTPEAAARIAQLGFQAELEQLIENARQVLPDLARIEVVLNERYDLGAEPGIAVEAYGKHPGASGNGTFWKLADRLVTQFPPEVLEHLHVSYHPDDGRAG